MEIALLRALLAVCSLRRLLDAESPVWRHVGEATAQLVYECEQLLDDRECLVHLAMLRQRIDGCRYRAQARDAAAGLQFPLRRLLSRLWHRLDDLRTSSDAGENAHA